MPVIGFLRDTSLADATHLVAAFRQGLKEAGFIEGQNVLIEYRSAEDQAHRLSALVDDLVRRQVALIVGNTPSSLAAKAATTTVPIVFVSGNDPVINGLVPNLNRPGGNTTGVSFLSSASVTKRLELLRQLAPKAAAIAMLVGSNLAPSCLSISSKLCVTRCVRASKATRSNSLSLSMGSSVICLLRMRMSRWPIF